MGEFDDVMAQFMVVARHCQEQHSAKAEAMQGTKEVAAVAEKKEKVKTAGGEATAAGQADATDEVAAAWQGCLHAVAASTKGLVHVQATGMPPQLGALELLVDGPVVSVP